MKNTSAKCFHRIFIKSIILLQLILGITLVTYAQLDEWSRVHELQLKEIRTASDRILVTYFIGPELNEIDVNSRKWSYSADDFSNDRPPSLNTTSKIN